MIFDHWYDPDPEAYKNGERLIVGTKLPIVSDQDGEENLERDTIQVVEQIACQTRARRRQLAEAPLFTALRWTLRNSRVVRLYFRDGKRVEGFSTSILVELENQMGVDALFRTGFQDNVGAQSPRYGLTKSNKTKDHKLKNLALKKAANLFRIVNTSTTSTLISGSVRGG